ncbi:uncharacterized protein LOC125673687 [Ostrea edulis]|uniref:uncharacterized protein LOC125673687 n=1 Tax=Ostrea edulis TaxID=37623 RepID=UPI0020962352|nr:uncharacterized protein LOC125673687 [Ostrea edulis]
MAGILQGSRGKPTYKLKCVVVGDLGVGKTTLVKSYADSGENDDPKSAWQKEISMDSCVVCLTIWDTAGQEKYRSLTGSYYRGAHCCIIVFDVNCLASFQHVREWYNDIEANSTNSKEIIKILVGTIRTSTARAVSPEKANSLADHLGLSYKEVNFENQKNIKDLFETLAHLTVLVYREHHFQSNVSITFPQQQKNTICTC